MGRHQPALLGGLFIGILSSLPYVGGANMCCCLWVVCGGVLVAYLQQQAKPEPIQTADAVLGGLLAGLLGAVIASIAGIITINMSEVLWSDQLRAELEGNPAVTPEIRDFVMNLVSGRNLILIILAFNLPMFAVFGMLGSLLGVAIFRKKVPPVAQG